MTEHLMADHVHTCIAIPPKHPVASMIGFLKGKSSIAIVRQLCGREPNFTGEHFWARGYAVSTVGFKLDQVPPLPSRTSDAGGSGGLSESWSKARFSATLKPNGQLPLRQSNSPSLTASGGLSGLDSRNLLRVL
jgi:hypothetical protein